MEFELVNGEGKAVTSADSVYVPDHANVARFPREVVQAVSRALPLNSIASDLNVFESQTAFEGGKPLDPESLLNVRDAKDQVHCASAGVYAAISNERHWGCTSGLLGGLVEGIPRP